MLGAAASAQTALDIEGNFTPPMDQFSAFANACAAWVDHGDAAFFDRLPAAAIDEYQAFATDHRSSADGQVLAGYYGGWENDGRVYTLCGVRYADSVPAIDQIAANAAFSEWVRQVRAANPDIIYLEEESNRGAILGVCDDDGLKLGILFPFEVIDGIFNLLNLNDIPPSFENPCVASATE